MKLKFNRVDLQRCISKNYAIYIFLAIVPQIFCLIAASIFYLISPKLYEADALIDLTSTLILTVHSNSDNKKNSDSKLLVHLQTPEYWIQKLRTPSTFGTVGVEGCSHLRNIEDQRALLSFLKVKTAQGNVNPSFIEVKVLGNNPQEAALCLDGIIDLIRQEDSRALEDWIDARKFELEHTEKRLGEAGLIVRQSSAVKSLKGRINVFIEKEVSNLFSIRERLLQEIDFGTHFAKMKVQKSFSDKPKYPNPKKILFIGMLAGAIISTFLMTAGIGNGSPKGIKSFFNRLKGSN